MKISELGQEYLDVSINSLYSAIINDEDYNMGPFYLHLFTHDSEKSVMIANVTLNSTVTPIVEELSPRRGSTAGGTTITAKGDGMLGGKERRWVE